MKRVCGVMVAVGLLVAGTARAQAQSLADLAKQEQERRKAVKEPSRVYTEADVRKMAPLTTAATRPQAEPAAAAAEGGDATTGAASTTASGAAGAGTAKAEKAEAPKDEAGWQARVQQAREDLARSRRLLAAMETQLVAVGLQNATAQVAGQASENAARQQETSKEIERLRADVQKYTSAVADIEAEARAAGVPPGWVR